MEKPLEAALWLTGWVLLRGRIFFSVVALACLYFGATLDVMGLSTWKTLSVILTGSFGILALLTEYKDKETKAVTTWGKVAAVGIVVSTAVGLFSLYIEESQKEASRLVEARKTNDLLGAATATLREIQRVTSPFSVQLISLNFRVACYKEKFRAFCAAALDKARDLGQKCVKSPVFAGPRVPIAPCDHGRWGNATVAQKEIWTSRPHSIPTPHGKSTVHLEIFSKNISADSISWITAGRPMPDYFLLMSADFEDGLSSLSLSTDEKFEQLFVDLSSTRILFNRRSSTIVGINDLQGATLVVWDGLMDWSGLEIQRMSMRTHAGMYLDIDVNSVRKVETPAGREGLMYMFPLIDVAR